jgi:hypothetical protein
MEHLERDLAPQPLSFVTVDAEPWRRLEHLEQLEIGLDFVSPSWTQEPNSAKR